MMSDVRPVRLAFFNHLRGLMIDKPAKKVWARMNRVRPRAPRDGEDWLQRYDIAVLHGANIDGQKIDYEYMTDSRVVSRDGFCCVLFSRVPHTRSPARVVGSWGVRYVLPLKVPHAFALSNRQAIGGDDTAELAWERLYQAVLRSGCIAAWFDSQPEGYETEHAALTEFFGRVDLDVVEWEVATSILCQGFLAVQAAAGDEEAAGAIGGAITGLCITEGEDVRAPAWWKTVLGETPPEQARLPEELMSAIYATTPDARVQITTSVVAQAYRELRGRLR